MATLRFIEKATIFRLFGIEEGFVFNYWYKQGKYNKNITKNLILDACGINIYEDSDFQSLSQQKCIEKIFNEYSVNTIIRLLTALSEYFCFGMGTDQWNYDDSYDYSEVQKIIERLKNTSNVALPEYANSDSSIILEDIQSNINDGKPELVIDRLHTYATQFIRNLCVRHSIKILDDKGNYFPLDTLVGSLKTWYEREDYFESEFAVVAIRNTINIFAKYNDLRNSKSAAHPNPLLNKIEAEYAVKIIAETLEFIDEIEKSKDVIQDEFERLPF